MDPIVGKEDTDVWPKRKGAANLSTKLAPRKVRYKMVETDAAKAYDTASDGVKDEDFTRFLFNDI